MGIVGPELLNVFSLRTIREKVFTVAAGRMVLPVRMHPRSRGLRQAGEI